MPLGCCAGVSGRPSVTAACGRGPTEGAVDTLLAGGCGALPARGDFTAVAGEGAEAGGGADGEWDHGPGFTPEGFIPRLASSA